MYETKVSDSVECLIEHMFLFLLFYKAYNDYVAVFILCKWYFGKYTLGE